MIFITGATGLVGGHLLWHLLQKNDRVVAIRRTTSNLEPLHSIFSFYTPNPDAFLARIHWRIADVLDIDSIQTALHNVTQVYHCAAIVSLGDEVDNMIDTNLQGTRNVLRASQHAGISKLCFVSSIAACGHASKEEKIDEESSWNENANRSEYSKSKYYSEQEVWKSMEEGLNAVIVNPGVILGLSGTDTGSAQLFSQVQKGLLFYTRGGSGYVDVRDVVKAMIALMNSEISRQRFVLVAENCCNKDILNWMADGFGKRRPLFCVGKKTLWIIASASEWLGKILKFRPLIDRKMAHTATQRSYYSSLKIQETIGFQFISIEQCIREVCEFRKRKGK